MSTTEKVTIDDINEGFADLYKPYNKSQALLEASRCTYCYDAPCIKACPTGIDIPTFIHQIRTQNVKGAAKTILSENIMGGTCARACPTEVLCERACVRHHDQGKPVEIGLLQRYAVDHILESTDKHPFVRAAETGKHIAVVGAGPAGLSCAHRAALLGHKVTVFEAKHKPGGLNEYGLAAYKMVDDFAQREVKFLLGIGGIEIIYEQYLGKNISLEKLRTEYDAVFLSIGLGLCNQLGLEGEKMSGVYDAIDFIEQLRQTADKSTMPIGQNVVVIGGGNTAIDAAIQARRLGAQKVTLAYRRSEQNMTATDWEIDLARKNGVDVRLWLSPMELTGQAHISTITFEQTTIEAGRLVGTGVREQIATDMVLKAVGQKLNASVLSGILIEQGKIKINDKYQTSIPGVYAGGDCIDTGEDLTVQSVEDGKRAAHAMGHTLFGIDFKEV
jgi:dihydropyrimidine dehydrogenase (NAD+) subunit PreT